MPRFSPRSPQAVLAGLMLLAGSAAAQVPQPAPPPPPAPPASIVPAPAVPQTAPAVPQAVPQIALPQTTLPQITPAAPPVSSAVVDPQVATLFSQAIAAHQALSSFYATITLVSTGSQPGANSSQTIKLAYKKPGYAKVAVSGSTGPIVQFYSDGSTLTQYIVKTKQYGTQPVPSGAQTIPLILNQARALLPRLIGNPAALNELLAQPSISASVTSSNPLALPALVGGAAVDTIVVLLPAPDGSKATFTFDIGRTDHLLRRLTENASLTNKGNPQTFTVTETVTAFRANPVLTASSFDFVPPPGVTKIKAAGAKP